MSVDASIKLQNKLIFSFKFETVCSEVQIIAFLLLVVSHRLARHHSALFTASCPRPRDEDANRKQNLLIVAALRSMFLQRFLSPVDIDSISSRLRADVLTVFKHWRYQYFEVFLEQGFKLFDDHGEFVPHASEVMAAWKAICADGPARASASYEAAQRSFLRNTEAVSATPSPVDQLRFRAPATFATPLTGYHASVSSVQASTATSKTVADALAEAEYAIAHSKKRAAASNMLLEILMQVEHQPYR